MNNPNPYAVSSVLESIQAACAQQLILQPNIGALNIPVLTEFVGDIEYTLLSALAGGATLAIVVSTPYAAGAQKNTPQPYWERIPVRAIVMESVTQNEYTGGLVTGTGTSGMAVCEYVSLAWQNFRPLNQGESMVPDEPNIGDPYLVATLKGVENKFQNCVFRDVNFFTQGGVQQLLQSFDATTFSQVGNQLTISGPSVSSVPVAGAALFYTSTTNGAIPSVPSPLNAASPQAPNLLYSGPITVAPGQKIRAAPWLAGYLAPNLGQTVYTCS